MSKIDILNINSNYNFYKLIKKYEQTLTKIVAKANNLIVKQNILIIYISQRLIDNNNILFALHRRFILKNSN